MEAAISAIVAVTGTILGAVLTYFFQERAARRAEASTLQRELRAERMSVYSSLLTALAEYRRGQLDWWWRRREDPRSDATFTARVESFRLRGLAQAALSQVQLIAGNRELPDAALEAWDLTHPVHHAEDRADLGARADAAKTAVDRFITLAAAEVQAGHDAGGASREWQALWFPSQRTGKSETSSSEILDHAWSVCYESCTCGTGIRLNDRWVIGDERSPSVICTLQPSRRKSRSSPASCGGSACTGHRRPPEGKRLPAASP